MNPQDYPVRYLYSASAFAAGGTLTRIDPDVEIDLQIPAIAPADLPILGGISETRAAQTSVRGQDANLDSIPAARRGALLNRELFSVASAHSLVKSDPETANGPAGSRTLTEFNALRMDGGLSIDSCRLEMGSAHDRTSPYPRFTLAGTELTGLRLGNYEVTVTLDLETFDQYPSLQALDAALQENRELRTQLSGRFVIDPKTGGLHRNAAGDAVGSFLKSVTGLPPGATLEGYTINWPGFGKIILGEIFLGPTVWRATMVQVVHSLVFAGGGTSGGCWYP